MRALMKVAAEPGLVLCDVPDPAVGPGDVLIRVLRTGICGTDLHIAEWDTWAQRTVRTPVVVGHEFVGEVVEVGTGVEGIAVGDIASGEGHLTCGRCRNCLAGRRHLCSHPLLLGVQRDGAFAELVCLPAANVWVHRPPIDLDIAAIFDPLGNAVHTALSFPLAGEDVLITGAGPIGVMAAAIAAHAGAARIVITDVNESRIGFARSLGDAVAVNVSRQRLEAVRSDLGIGDGFAVGMEMSGSASALREMIANMRHGGGIALLGLPPQGEQSLDLSTVIHRLLTIRGICGREIFATWQTADALLRSSLDIHAVVTHRLPCDAYATAFEVMRAGECGKVILDWSEPRDLASRGAAVHPAAASV